MKDLIVRRVLTNVTYLVVFMVAAVVADWVTGNRPVIWLDMH